MSKKYTGLWRTPQADPTNRTFDAAMRAWKENPKITPELCIQVQMVERGILAPPASPQLTSSVEDSHASPSPSPASDKEPMMSAGSGPNLPESFAWYDPDTHSLRMSQACLVPTTEGPCPRYSGTWPRAGTMRNGIVSQRSPSGRRTSDGESLLWPTPKVMDAERTDILTEARYNERTGRKSLKSEVGKSMWPTMEANERNAYPRMTKTRSQGQSLEPNLAGAVKMWPTPGTQETTGGPGNPQRMKEQGHQIKLKDAVGGQLNPTWVEWLMGFPLGWTDLKH